MELLNRVKTLIQVKKPRALEFIRDYDKLRHGRVTGEQFFRAFESSGITFTAEERDFVLRQWTVKTQAGVFLDYVSALKELETPVINTESANMCGSLSGATFAFSRKQESGSAFLNETLEKLRRGCISHPIVGKLFFLDFDRLKDGIVTATNFGRGLSAMYEALFRAYPTQQEILTLSTAFSVKRLKEQASAAMDPKEISTAFSMQADTVDYRVFCDAIGATKVFETQEVSKVPTNDPGFGRFVSVPSHSMGEEAFEKLKIAHRKFRYDLKSFLQARDKRKTGQVSLRDFVAALRDAIPDEKRANLDSRELFEVGNLFLTTKAFLKDPATGKTGTELDIDLSVVAFKAFLDRIYQEAQEIANTLYVAPSAAGHEAVEICAAFFAAHPVILRAEFEAFDPRRTGRVTSGQFQQVLGQYFTIKQGGSNVEQMDPPQKLLNSQKVNAARTGITTQQIAELVKLYTVDTTSGVGNADNCTVSPDKLVGAGFLIDYSTFLRDIRAEDPVVLKNKPEQKRVAVNQPDSGIQLPAMEIACFKVAEQLRLRHQKLSDCFNQGEPGSTKWNRTTFGRIQARVVQRSLNNLLQIALGCPEIATFALTCPDESGLKFKDLIQNRCQETADGWVLSITPQELELALDKAEISVKALTEALRPFIEGWNPIRSTGYSYNSGCDTRAVPVVGAAKQDREGMDAIYNATKHMSNEHDEHNVQHLLKVFGPQQPITLKGQQYTLQQLAESAHGGNSLGDEYLDGAAISILQLYYELHVNRSQPITFFQEFDKLKSGYVTPDQFSRSLVTAGIDRVLEKYPKSFAALLEVYREKTAGRFQNMIDYAYFLREVGKPPANSMNIPMEEMFANKKSTQAERKDYQSLQREAEEKRNQNKYLASLDGVLQTLVPVCLKYRPKCRDYFWDFDKRRTGICPAEKLGAVLGMMNAELSREQVETLQGCFESKKPGFQGCFEWKNFVEALEKAVGMRL